MNRTTPFASKGSGRPAARTHMIRQLTFLLGVTAVVSSGCGQPDAVAVSDASLPSSNAPDEDRKGRSKFLVDRDALAKSLGKDNLVVIDTRPLDEFRHSHIPGAVRIDANAWARQGNLNDGLTDKEFWSQEIASAGIDKDSEVVVYAGKSPAAAARVWWHLRYAGVENVRLLDGGWNLWVAGGKETTADVPDVAPSEFSAEFVSEMLAASSSLLEEPDGATKIDARSEDEYRGRGGDENAQGHITGAIHIEWKQLLDGHSRFKPDDDLHALFKDHGLDPDNPVVTYCRSGGRASVNAFVLKMLGYKDVKNYYRGWSEWSRIENAPIEK